MCLTCPANTCFFALHAFNYRVSRFRIHVRFHAFHVRMRKSPAGEIDFRYTSMHTYAAYSTYSFPEAARPYTFERLSLAPLISRLTIRSSIVRETRYHRNQPERERAAGARGKSFRFIALPLNFLQSQATSVGRGNEATNEPLPRDIKSVFILLVTVVSFELWHLFFFSYFWNKLFDILHVLAVCGRFET